ncbi:MAG: Sua5/YciO/YrdC/YwlC family protein, partial [Candidatus Rokuibacteriota bacterium]
MPCAISSEVRAALPHHVERGPGSVIRRAIDVTGIVQGVGFRPFVHGLAQEFRLGGFVKNWAGGALIEVEGEVEILEQFVGALQTRRPAPARIDGLHTRACAPHGDETFRIEPSEWAAPGHVTIAADLATCDDCRRELFDPDDRRYRYPFITCAHCGPRLTIVTQTPYDRERTTMAGFVMCDACRAEYEDPRDRRFHAQSIACPTCGPRLRATDRHGVPLDGQDPLALALGALRGGQIVAVKGIGGYHLACDAGDAAVVAELRRRKARDEKPFAIMVTDLGAAQALCEVSPVEGRVLTSPARPIVLLRRRPGSTIAGAVAPGMGVLGVMLPYTPLHILLLHEMRGRALVMTSGNLSDEPIVHDDG